METKATERRRRQALEAFEEARRTGRFDDLEAMMDSLISQIDYLELHYR